MHRRLKVQAIGLAFLVLAPNLVLSQERAYKPAFIKPVTVNADQLPKLIEALPKYSPFSLSGLAIFNGRLFAGSNLGIVEVQGNEVVSLLRFHRPHSVVSRVTLDLANHALWADDDEAGGFLRFDGDRWTHIEWPASDKGSYTRKDVSMGPTLISNHWGLWLSLAGGGWKWNAAETTWTPLGTSVLGRATSTDGMGIIGIVPMGAAPLMIVRSQGRFVGGRRGQAIAKSDEIVNPIGVPKTIRRETESFMAESWTTSQDADYICTTDHSLVRVTPEVVSSMSAPGECEVVSTDDKMNLLVIIKHKGVFRYKPDEGWTPIAQSPYPSGDGDYSSYLASSGGFLAMAIDGEPVVDTSKTTAKRMSFTRNAPIALWVLKDDRFLSVRLH